MNSFLENQMTGNIIIKDPTSCPHCFVTAMGFDEIVKDFGLRNMDDGTIRIQSWCRNCRKDSHKEAIA